ncbi:MAG: heavy metal translocating P-type ATPase [Chitinophagaceae bacterium]
MEKISWKVEGMTCSNCALSVHKVLEKQGMKNVQVNALNGDVLFEKQATDVDLSIAQKNIEDLGYHVVNEQTNSTPKKKPFLHSYIQKFWFCFPFTLLLMIGHWTMSANIHVLHFLHNAWVQLAICLPVFVVGMQYFGRSAYKSLSKGVPNMNVLIAMGAFAAFIYSLIGTIGADNSKIFYETAASIITIVFLGNWMEDFSVEKTQKAITALTKYQKVMANMLTYDSEQNEHIFSVENIALKVGDLILVKTGEQVPMDCKILSGEALVNEAIISGESLPLLKKQGDILIGGSVLANGNVKCYVTATGKDTVLNGIVQLMQAAQNHKPPMQQLADKISAIFVPLVLGIAVLTIIVNYFFFNESFGESLMRSIAVLVISCPCAMGLATPAAIAVGLGRAAKNGILYAKTDSMELFAKIKQMVFDKTGTLTTGNFTIQAFETSLESEEAFKKLVYSIEKFSNHPIAKSIATAWKTNQIQRWKQVEEMKGLGMKAVDKDGNTYLIGSSKISTQIKEPLHHLYVLKNDSIIGWLDITDEIRPEAKDIIEFCKQQQIKPILLSGDNEVKCKQIADKLGIETIYFEQTPAQKLQTIEALCKVAPTVMVGDGINDAPALAKATISISLSAASQLAIQSSSVILMNSGLQKLPAAMLLGKHTYNTVKGNLFWAFFYNIIAIPVAAIGLLTPTAGALIMGLSDVVLAINSLRLNWKKITV